MKSYVWLTFGFMGWAYYEMSGGAEFEPIEREVAAVEEPAPEIVTRAANPTLLAVSTSNVTSNVPVAAPQADIDQAVAEAVALDSTEAEPEVIAIVAPVAEPMLDIRSVKGNLVNMRMGPGTNFDVITTLDGGTELEILQANADGWANVATVDRGIEGWMAERLLTAPET